ncbi:hypothetical protein C8R46DRAFT_1029725 [Mycena filopes]|nr:hypothetical protein C8R46DRAFT_1029725 [Mycena filopes]
MLLRRNLLCTAKGDGVPTGGKDAGFALLRKAGRSGVFSSQWRKWKLGFPPGPADERRVELLSTEGWMLLARAGLEGKVSRGTFDAANGHAVLELIPRRNYRLHSRSLSGYRLSPTGLRIGLGGARGVQALEEVGDVLREADKLANWEDDFLDPDLDRCDSRKPETRPLGNFVPVLNLGPFEPGDKRGRGIKWRDGGTRNQMRA